LIQLIPAFRQRLPTPPPSAEARPAALLLQAVPPELSAGYCDSLNRFGKTLSLLVASSLPIKKAPFFFCSFPARLDLPPSSFMTPNFSALRPFSFLSTPWFSIGKPQYSGHLPPGGPIYPPLRPGGFLSAAAYLTAYTPKPRAVSFLQSDRGAIFSICRPTLFSFGFLCQPFPLPTGDEARPHEERSLGSPPRFSSPDGSHFPSFATLDSVLNRPPPSRALLTTIFFISILCCVALVLPFSRSWGASQL